jgi:hypothetical protein
MSVFDPMAELEMDRRPRVLVFGASRWDAGVRIAKSFCDSRCEVAALFPERHNVERLPHAITRFSFRASQPLSSLAAAITSFAADVVVPTCDRGATMLHRLHYQARRQGMPGVADRIERSLGYSPGFAVAENRYALLAIARQEGVTVPEMCPMLDECDFSAWRGGYPCVLKTDGSDGLLRMRVVRTQQEACLAWNRLRKKSPAELLKQLALTRDRWTALAEWREPPAAVMAQAWVHGQPASCAAACWRGDVLAATCVEIVARKYEFGPATVVDVVDGRAMARAARRVAARLGLSGIVEFDFVLERPGGKPFLIGMHARATDTATLALGRRRSVATVLAARLAGEAEPAFTLMKRRTRVAFPSQGVFVRTSSTSNSASREVAQDGSEPSPEPSLLGAWLQRIMPPRHETRRPWVYTEASEPEQNAHGSRVA